MHNRAVNRKLTAPPRSPHVTDNSPKTLVTNQKLPPIAYIIELKTIHCTTCNAHHVYSEAYELRIYSNYKNLTPVRSRTDLRYNMPIQVSDRGVAFTAICHECTRPGMLSHLPKPPQLKVVVSGAQAPTAPKPKAPKPKHAPSIDDTD
jgi:hypothetical protein